jgi:hypothetical protein
MGRYFGMLPGPAEEQSARPRLPLNVLPAFAKLWEVTVGSAVSGRANVRMEQLRFCSTDFRKILWCGPLVKYVEKRKAVG